MIAKIQDQQSIEQKLIRILNNFVISTRKRKDKLFNKFLAKRIDSNNSNIIFQMDSVINTSKSDEVKLFKAISELKNLTGNNSWNNGRQQFSEQTQQNRLITKTVEEEEKIEEDLDFLLDNNINQK